MWISRSFATAACALLAAPLPAAAAPSGRAVVEQALGQQAEVEYAAGRFKQAAVLFHRAFEQRQDVGYLYSAGRAEQQGGLLDEAAASYATVLRLAPKGSEFARKARLYLDAITALRSRPPAPAAQPSASVPAPAQPASPPARQPPPADAAATAPSAPVAVTPTVASAMPPVAPIAVPESGQDAPNVGWWLLAGGAALAVGGAGFAWSTWRDVRRLDEAVSTAPASTKAQAAQDYKAAALAAKGPIVGGWAAAGVGVAAVAYGVWSLRGGSDGPSVAVAPGPGPGLVLDVRF